MKTQDNIYVGGAWVRSGGSETIAVVNPATEEVMGHASAGCAQDVAIAVAAARQAFAAWSARPVAERVAWVDRIREGVLRRADARIAQLARGVHRAAETGELVEHRGRRRVARRRRGSGHAFG